MYQQVLDSKGRVVMKRFTRIAVATFALLVPTFAAAQNPVKMVYRPELRTMVPVKAVVAGNPILRSRREEIARHEAMAAGYKVAANHNGVGNFAVHCDRLIAELRAEGAFR
jgi:hypothetical protein